MAVSGDSREFMKDTDDEKASSLSKRVWELFGFGSQYVWMLCVLFVSSVFGYAPSSTWSQMARMSIVCGITLGYLAFYLFRKRLPRGRLSRGLIIAGGCLGSFATLLITLPLPSIPAALRLCVAGLCAGVSNPTAMLGGNKLWADHRPERALMQIATSAPVAALIAWVTTFVPTPLSIGIAAICPLLGNCILASSKAGKPRAGSYRRTEIPRVQTARLIIFMVCFAFVTAAILGFLAPDDVGSLHAYASYMLIPLVVLLSAAFLYALRARESAFLIMLQKYAVPLGLIGLMLIVLLPISLQWIGVSLVLSGYIFADLFMWLFHADLVARQHKDAFTTLAVTCSWQWAGLAAGFFCGYAISGGLFGQASAERIVPVALAVIILVVARSIVFDAHRATLLIEARTEGDIESHLEQSFSIAAEERSLSARETEVFLMVVRGRSIPYVARNLVLSESTVKTHMRNIYRKFGVETRQQLLDAVERGGISDI